MPKLNDRNLQETHKSTETHKFVSTCFPNFGKLFGLTEDAAEIFLIEMGLLTMLKKNIQGSDPKDGMIFVKFSKYIFRFFNAKVQWNLPLSSQAW